MKALLLAIILAVAGCTSAPISNGPAPLTYPNNYPTPR